MMQIRREGDPAFPTDTENENSAAPSAEETTVHQTPSPEEDKASDAADESQQDGEPGSRDPKSGLNNPSVERWQEREADWKTRFNDQEKRHTDELAALRKDLDDRFANVGKQAEGEAPPEVPAWFGGDEQQWGEFRNWNETLAKNAADSVRKELTAESEAEQKRIDDATSWLNSEVSTIEADKDLNPQGQTIDRNKLLKYALDNDVVDSKGRWNYKAAFRLMGAENVFKAKNALNERKQIASATTSDRRAEAKSSPYKTSEDFQHSGSRPW